MKSPVTCCSDGDLLRFQRSVTQIVLKIAIKGDDGEDLCNLTVKADSNHSTEEILENILVELSAKWECIYNEMISHLYACQFGELEEHRINQIDTVQAIGVLLMTGFKDLHQRDGASDFSNHMIDMAASLSCLEIMRCSYESNPSNEELDSLVKTA